MKKGKSKKSWSRWSRSPLWPLSSSLPSRPRRSCKDFDEKPSHFLRKRRTICTTSREEEKSSWTIIQLTPGDDVRRVHLTWFYTLQASQRLFALDEADEQCFKRSQHVQPGQPAPWTSCPGCPRWSCPPGEPPRPPRRRPRHASSSSAPLQSAALTTSTRCF